MGSVADRGNLGRPDAKPSASSPDAVAVDTRPASSPDLAQDTTSPPPPLPPAPDVAVGQPRDAGAETIREAGVDVLPTSDAPRDALTFDGRPPATVIPSNSVSLAFPDWHRQLLARVAAVKGKRVDLMFIGDSITANWTGAGKAVWDKHYGHRYPLNFGMPADSTQNVLWRLDTLDVRDLRPKVAVILIGTNNTGATPTDIAIGVQAIIEKTFTMYPGVKIILLPILPNARATAKMAAANVLIAPMADNRDIFLYDLASQMTPVGNSWKGLLPDRLHLTAEGYTMWAEGMEPLLMRLLPTN